MKITGNAIVTVSGVGGPSGAAGAVAHRTPLSKTSSFTMLDPTSFGDYTTPRLRASVTSRTHNSQVSLPMGHDPSRVGQVGPVASCGQVGDIDPSLVKSRNLSQVGQVRPVGSCGLVRNIDSSGSK